MGKGIALQFKQTFPLMFKAYEKEARAGRVVPGKMHVFETGSLLPRVIINFPTKRHWRDKSLLEDIDAGLLDLIAQAGRLQLPERFEKNLRDLDEGAGGEH
jgi:O-acetyl-ADP-ribose deacetylase (regulator of RNase III)